LITQLPSAISSPTDARSGVGKDSARSAAVMAPAGQLVAALEHVRVRDLLPADADLDGDVVIAHQIAELLQQVVLVGGGLGDGGVVDARAPGTCRRRAA
jgi:hypothetical protein